MLKFLKTPLYLKKIGVLENNEICSIKYKILNRGSHKFYFTSDSEIMENMIGQFITIGINIPDSKNMLTESSLEKLRLSIKNFECNNDIYTAVVHGCGGNFCTGIVDSKKASKLSQILIEEFHAVKKPIIAALDGHITNFGLQLAIMCDIRIMEKSAVAGFQAKGDKLELSPLLYKRLIMNIGPANAFELLASRKMWLATECLTAGLVNKIADSGCALGQSMLLAQNISFNNSLENVIEYKSKILSFLTKSNY